MSTSSSSTPSWSAGARSVAEFSGDCRFSFGVPASVGGVVAGLNSLNVSSQPEEIQHGFMFTGGTYYVIESGIRRTADAAIAGQSFSVSRVSGQVSYLVDGAVIYTSLTTSTGTVFLDVSLLVAGDEIIGATSDPIGGVVVSFPVLMAAASDTANASVLASLPPMSVYALQDAFATAALPPMQARSANGVIVTPAGVSVAMPPMAAYSEGGLWPGVSVDFPPIQCSAFSDDAPVGVSVSFVRMLAMVARSDFDDSSELLLPAITSELPLFGGAAITCPTPFVFARGRGSLGDYAAAITCPMPTSSALGGAVASAAMPKFDVAGTGTVTKLGMAAIVAPSFIASGAGTVGGVGRGAASMPMATVVGYAGAVCSVTIGGFTVEATGTGGAIGRGAVTCPLFEVSASARIENHGGANIVCPSPRLGVTGIAWVVAPSFKAEAIGTATVTATYEAYAVNLLHSGPPPAVDEVTRYTNFPFTHVVRYKNSYFGVNTTGMYLLEGTTDDGDPIAYDIETHPDTLGKPTMKTVASAYLSGRIDPELTMRVVAGEDRTNTYSYDSPRGETAQTHRVKFGRGIKDRYLAIGVAGEGAIELDGIELEVNTLSRRI